MPSPAGRINLPVGMILRCLPPEVLAADISEFEASGAAATEIGLPMNLILGQLPSGKVEMPLRDLVPHFPPGYLQPTASISSYLPNLINLPLMDVVMRIPPDLLALRPDQKEVDASVINMADPFTEEILREQAEAARQTKTNIIDESQVPATEEFVPRDQVKPAPTFVPPPRPSAPTMGAARTVPMPVDPPAPPVLPPMPTPAAAKAPAPPAPVSKPAPAIPASPISSSGFLIPPTPSPAAPAPAVPSAPSSSFLIPPTPSPAKPAVAATPAPPAPASKPPAPPAPATSAETSGGFIVPPASNPRTGAIPPIPTVVRPNSPVPPPAPNATSRTISASGRLPTPTRATTPIPARPQAAVTMPVALPKPSAPSPIPSPVPDPTAAGPQTDFLTPPSSRPLPSPQTPQPPLRSPAIPAVPGNTQMTTSPVEEIAPATEKPAEPSFPRPGQPDPGADTLQRLAALAMQELEAKEKALDPAPASEEPSAKETAAKESAAEEPAPEEPTVTEPEAKAPEAAVPAEEPKAPAPTVASGAFFSPPPGQVVPAVAVAVAALTASETLRSTLEQAPTQTQARPFGNKSITSPMPAISPAVTQALPEPAAPETSSPAAAPAASVALNINSCQADELVQIPGCTRVLADSIVRYRTKIGSFKRIEDLLEVPGMNSAAYSSLTGETPPQSGVSQSLSELLGFPPEQKVSLKDVTERIGCWPDVTGCVLSQSDGLSLVGHVPKGLDMAAIVAFAPRIFEGVNKSFGEIAGKETDELIIPASGTSFHIFRNNDLYLIILSRLPQMPDRHVKIARLVLAGLSLRPHGAA
jgi:competence ComEA-like helix-hairpin-helix protein